MRAQTARYYRENRDRILAKWDDPEYRERQRKNARKPKRAAKKKQKAAAYRDANREVLREKRREYHRSNPQKAKAKKAKRRAMEKGAKGKTTASQISFLQKTLNYRCVYCNEPLGTDWHLDHLVPLSKGGTNYPNNLVPSCAKCNLQKGRKSLKNFVLETMRFPARKFRKILRYVGLVSERFGLPENKELMMSMKSQGLI
jgi:5-methylcytosine-specific restriction endonuclease McrA